MKILVAFPDVAYYNWQVLVQINNLVKFGYADQMIYVVGQPINRDLSKQICVFKEELPAEFYVYLDDRQGAFYPSSQRPYILEKFFREHPEMNKETFLYIDPDLLFSKNISFSQLEKNDTWYLSDTKSYIDSKYIKSKSEELFWIMCDIVKINKEIVEKNDDSAGGAQYLMKDIDADFWKKVYEDSEELYGLMKRTEGYYSPQHPIQSWTADMWAVLWNAWYFGHETKIANRMSFSWACDPIEKYDQHNFFHNAGVVGQNDNMFCKTKYQESPFNTDFSEISDRFCSIKYMEEIEETKNNYPELIKLF